MTAAINKLTATVQLFSRDFNTAMGTLKRGTDDVAAGVEGLRSNIIQTTTAGVFLGNILETAVSKVASFITNIATESIQAGLRLEQLGVATRFLGEKAGYTSQFIDDLAMKIEKTGISGTASRESIQSLLGAHIDLAKATELSAIAQNMQSISGRSSSEVFQLMTRALSTGNTEILRGIGFQTLSMNALNQTTGATVGAAKTQVILNALLKEGATFGGLYGASMETAGKQASSADRAWSQVSERLGTIILPITSTVIKAWYALGQAVRDKMKDAGDAVKEFVEASARRLQTFIDKTAELTESMIKWAGKTLELLGSMQRGWEALPEPISKTAVMLGEVALSVWAINTAVSALVATRLFAWGTAAVAVFSEWFLLIKAFGWEAVALGFSTIAAAITPLVVAIGGLILIWNVWKAASAETGWAREVSDAFEYAALRVQGFSAAEADAMIATQHVTEQAIEQAKRLEAIQKALGKIPGAPVVPNPPPVVPDQYGKQIAEMYAQLAKGSKETAIAEAALRKLSATQLENFDVLSRAVPKILELAAAHRPLSMAMLEAHARYVGQTLVINELGLEKLKDIGLTAEQIKFNMSLGVTLADMAIFYNVNVVSMQQYLEWAEKDAKITKLFANEQLSLGIGIEKVTLQVDMMTVAIIANQTAAGDARIALREWQEDMKDFTEVEKAIRAANREMEALLKTLDFRNDPMGAAAAAISIIQMRDKMIASIYEMDEVSQRVLFANLDTEAKLLTKLPPLYKRITDAALETAESLRLLADISGSEALAKVATVAHVVATALRDVGEMATAIRKGDAIGSIIAGIKLATNLAVSMWDTITRSSGEKAAAEMGRDFGAKFSEEFGDVVAATAKDLFRGDRFAASTFHLSDIIDEMGGVNSGNVEMLTGKLRDVFVMLETGAFTSAQAVKVLDENFNSLVKDNTDSLGFWSSSLKEIIALNDRFGTQSKAIADAVKGQAMNIVASFNMIMVGTEKARKGYADLKKAIDDATEKRQKALDDGSADDTMGVDTAKGKKFRELDDALTAALERQHAAAESQKRELTDLGLIATAAFAIAIDKGATFAEALAAAQPGLTDLRKAYEDLGMNIEDPFVKMLAIQSSLMENNPALIQGASGLAGALVGMTNLNMLNVDTFAAMGRVAMDTYTRIQSEVAAVGGSTRDALLPMQDYLHAAAKAAEDLNLPLDEHTQMMIQQSKDLGIWKDQGPTAAEAMQLATESLTAAIERLTLTLQGIPDELPNPFRNWTMPIGDPTDIEAGGRDAGGVVSASGPQRSSRDTIPMWLRPGEVVLTPEQVQLSVPQAQARPPDSNNIASVVLVIRRDDIDPQEIGDLAAEGIAKHIPRNGFDLRTIVTDLVVKAMQET